MNKLRLIKNAELFQGERYLNKKKTYFEVQIITNNRSYFVDYKIKDFEFKENPFCIRIGKNHFSKEGININIEDESQKLKICGKIEYSNHKNIKTNILAPNIMGPFSYIPFMECNHAIISMQNTINGYIKIKDETIVFNDNKGYIEKDWGCSFPKSYIWCQGNHFQKSNANFMFSIAEIPFKLFTFQGLICVLQINNNKGLKLVAPVKGKMAKKICESICACVTVTLKKEKKIIFCDTSNRCGLEIVQK